MKSNNLRNRIGRILLALSFLVTVGLVSSTVVQAQWNRDRDRDNRRDQNRDYRRDRRDRDGDYRRNDQYGRNGGYGNNGGYGGYGNNGGYGGYGNQAALNQGYQDGVYTGSNDAQRGQNYNPQRSHYYRNAGNNSGYGNGGGYAQAYRNGFLQGYQAGYQRYGGNNRSRRGNGNYGRFPFPW